MYEKWLPVIFFFVLPDSSGAQCHKTYSFTSLSKNITDSRAYRVKTLDHCGNMIKPGKAITQSLTSSTGIETKAVRVACSLTTLTYSRIFCLALSPWLPEYSCRLPATKQCSNLSTHCSSTWNVSSRSQSSRNSSEKSSNYDPGGMNLL